MGVACQSCGALAEKGAKFCTECGEKLNKFCSSCGAILELNARFCGECGVHVVAEDVIQTQVKRAPRNIEEPASELENTAPQYGGGSSGMSLEPHFDPLLSLYPEGEDEDEARKKEDEYAAQKDKELESDPIYQQAVAIVKKTRRASITLIQRQLKISYSQAARYIEGMERHGIVSPVKNDGYRDIFVTSTSNGARSFLGRLFGK